MSRVLRLRGLKYDVDRFTLSELASAAEHVRRQIEDSGRFLAALLEEQQRRAGADLRAHASGAAAPTSARPAAAPSPRHTAAAAAGPSPTAHVRDQQEAFRATHP